VGPGFYWPIVSHSSPQSTNPSSHNAHNHHLHPKHKHSIFTNSNPPHPSTSKHNTHTSPTTLIPQIITQKIKKIPKQKYIIMQKNNSNLKVIKNKKNLTKNPKKPKKHNSPPNSFSNIRWFFNLNTLQHTNLSPQTNTKLSGKDKKMSP